MSLRLGNSSVIDIVDPNYENRGNNGRVNFRFQKDQVYSSDIKLRIGVDLSASTGDVDYNAVLGVMSSIKRIRLMDGSTELESTPVNDDMSWVAFKHINRSNDTNVSMNNYLLKNRLGFTADGFPSWTNNVLNYDSVKINNYNLFDYDAVKNNDQEYYGLVSLRDYFPMLRATPILSTEIFKNLSVEIELKDSAWTNLLYIENTASVQTARSELYATKFVGSVKDDLMRGFKKNDKLLWNTIESDTVLYQKTTGVVENNVQNFNLKGYNNKYVGRVLLANNSETNTIAPMLSEANDASGFQVRVNGVNVLPNSHKRGSNRLNGQMVDSWGEMNTSFFVYPSTVFPTNIYDVNAAVVSALNANIHYMGVNVNQKVNRFELSLIRSTTATAEQSKMRVLAEVLKVLTIRSDGTYNIQYV